MIKMKGSEILERIKCAKGIVARRSGMLGEIGDFLRSHGYEVHQDGFSVCNFGEKDVKLSYKADNCCGRPWGMYEAASIGDVCEYTPAAKIDPDKDYDVPLNLSTAEKIEKGILKPKSYLVISQHSGHRNRMGKRDSLKEAEEFAVCLCQKEINRLREDSTWRPYTPSSVRDNPLSAKERGEVRHYTNYDYKGHECWFAILAVIEEGL